MEIVEVISAQHHKAFIKFPHQLYKNDAEWVAPLNQDIEEENQETVRKLFNEHKTN
jgi:hypothetical protein